MKKLTILIIIILCQALVFAQQNAKENCASDYLHIKALKENTAYKSKFDKNNSSWEEWNRKSTSQKQASVNSPTTLTVVFHDLKNDPGLDFLIDNSGSYQYVVDKLNLIFDGTNLGGKPQTNNTLIQFCLALQDVSGNSYVGNQTHHVGSLPSIDNTDQQQIDLIVDESLSENRFPTTKYINIYIVDKIIGSVAGFATLPSMHGGGSDGIFLERQFLINNSSLDSNMNVLAHEMGHYLGLFHVFGICNPEIIVNYPNCSCDNSNPLFNGDMVADTPPSMMDLSQVNCSTTFDTCSSNGLDDKFNYMDYGNWSCQNRFTLGQIDRMHFMIDPLFGARKSLLATNSCANCIAMDNCQFEIVPISPQNQVVSGSLVAFNVAANLCTNNPSLAYNWELINLDSQTSVFGTGSNFSSTISIVGNYKIIFSASLVSNSNCIETTSYQFQVNPIQGSSGPGSSQDYCATIPDMNFTNFERFYNPSWNLSGSTSVSITGTDDGFDIFQSNTFNDTNFLNATVPSGVTKILRVGKIINATNSLNNGSQYSVKVKFKPTPDNCKFKVHFLKMGEGVGNGNSELVSNSGVICKFTYNTNVYGAPQTKTIIANSSLGYNNFFHHIVNNLANSQITSYNGVNYNAMNNWESYILDFSEFAKLNEFSTNNFEVELTFYSKTNGNSNGSLHAYSYFGLECLGGGIPKFFDWNPENIDNPCAFPSTQSCFFLPLPKPQVAFPIPTTNWDSTFYGFVKLVLLESSTDNVTYSPNSAIPTFVNNEFGVNLCQVESQNSPFLYYRITYKTLLKTFTKTIRITNQYYHNTICSEPPLIDGIPVYGGIIKRGAEKEFLYCPTSTVLPEILLEAPCFTEPSSGYEYQWFRNSIGNSSYVEIIGQTNQSLNLNTILPSDQPKECLTNYKRKVKYIDPFCGNIQYFDSEVFSVYNLVGFVFNSNKTINDICVDENINLTLNNIKLFYPICLDFISNNAGSSANNTIQLQLYKDLGLTNPLPTAIQTIAMNNMYAVTNGINFNFSNILSGTNDPIFLPGNHSVYIKVTYNFYGCSTSIIHVVNFNIKPSAVGGSIGLQNTCITNNITSINNGFTNVNYDWEYSLDNGVTYETLLGAPNTAFINNINNFLSNLPVLIRRKSKSFPNCQTVAYSNSLEINSPSTPSLNFSFPTTYCYNSQIDSFPNNTNNISGYWTPSISNTQSLMYTFHYQYEGCEYTYNQFVTILPLSNPACSNICPDFLTLSMAQIGNPIIYQRHMWIVAQNNYSVSGSQNVTLRAGDYVELLPNSYYDTSGIFEAYIQDCLDQPRFSQELPVESKAIKVFPNPTNGIVQIESFDTELQQISIQSIDGKVVFDKEVNDLNAYQIDISRYASGVYLINLSTNDGKFHTRKLIKN